MLPTYKDTKGTEKSPPSVLVVKKPGSYTMGRILFGLLCGLQALLADFVCIASSLSSSEEPVEKLVLWIVSSNTRFANWSRQCPVGIRFDWLIYLWRLYARKGAVQSVTLDFPKD